MTGSEGCLQEGWPIRWLMLWIGTRGGLHGARPFYFSSTPGASVRMPAVVTRTGISNHQMEGGCILPLRMPPAPLSLATDDLDVHPAAQDASCFNTLNVSGPSIRQCASCCSECHLCSHPDEVVEADFPCVYPATQNATRICRTPATVPLPRISFDHSHAPLQIAWYCGRRFSTACLYPQSTEEQPAGECILIPPVAVFTFHKEPW